MEIKTGKGYGNNQLFITGLTLFTCFLGLELFFRVYDLYRIFPDVDIVSHILSGVTLYVIIYWILTKTKAERKNITTLSFTLLIAFAWEAVEYLEDRIVLNTPYLVDYFFWDGAVDIITTMLGAVIGMGILKLLKMNN
ncbi:MAG: hypothetical protein ABIH63_02190 [archaeon]